MVRCSAAAGVMLLATWLAGCEPGNLSGPAGIVVNGPPGPPPLTGAAPSSAIGATTEPTTEPVASEPSSFEIPLPTSASAEFAPPSESPALPVQAPATPAAPAAEAAAIPFVNLSAGIALPQLLPEGTQVGVSVDYSLRGNPKTSCRYFLVVESSAGEVALPVTLDPRRGTFQSFLPATVRPEHQPFRARIDEVSPTGERTRVSNSAVLATSY